VLFLILRRPKILFLPQKIFSQFLVLFFILRRPKILFLPQKIFGHFLVLFFILRRAQRAYGESRSSSSVLLEGRRRRA
jgi:hypothetical protein